MCHLEPFPSMREPTHSRHPGSAHPLNPYPWRLKEFSTAVSFQLNSHCFLFFHLPPALTFTLTEITSYIMESCTYPVKNMTAWQQDLQCKKCWIKPVVSKFLFKARNTCFKRHFATSKTENWNALYMDCLTIRLSSVKFIPSLVSIISALLCILQNVSCPGSHRYPPIFLTSHARAIIVRMFY